MGGRVSEGEADWLLNLSVTQYFMTMSIPSLLSTRYGQSLINSSRSQSGEELEQTRASLTQLGEELYGPRGDDPCAQAYANDYLYEPSVFRPPLCLVRG